MANTFSKIYMQFVFAVKNRQCLIASENKEELQEWSQVAPTEPGTVVYFCYYKQEAPAEHKKTGI